MHWIDPQSLPSIEGVVAQFVMNRDGELDGLLLLTCGGDTRLVHFPPHMGGAVERAIKVGDDIAVHGVKPRGADVIAAVSLVTANRVAIVDQGPDATHAGSVQSDDEAVHDDAEVRGTVRLSLFGPKGELRGAILDDGTVLRLGKKESAVFCNLLQPGASLAARGSAIVCAHSTMLDVQAIGTDAANLRPVKEKKQDKPDRPKRESDDPHVDA